MTELRFVVMGEPIAWARARKGKARGHFYTDDQTKGFKTRVAWAAKLAMREHNPPLEALMGACALTVDAYFGALKDAKHGEPIPKDTKPDTDNIGKGIGDALNKIAYCDDGRLADTHYRKWWAKPGDEPCTWVVLRSLTGEWESSSA